MDKYESAGGDGAGHDSSPKQNQQKRGTQTDIPGEMENGKGVRPESAEAQDTKKVEPLKTPKVYPPPGFKPSE